MLSLRTDLDRLIDLAFDRTPTPAEVEEVARSECIPVEQLLDRFARSLVGERMAAGRRVLSLRG